MMFVSTSILLLFTGIATGYTFNCLYKKSFNGEEKVLFGGFEVAGDETKGTLIQDFHPTGVYFHCNTCVFSGCCCLFVLFLLLFFFVVVVFYDFNYNIFQSGLDQFLFLMPYETLACSGECVCS